MASNSILSQKGLLTVPWMSSVGGPGPVGPCRQADVLLGLLGGRQVPKPTLTVLDPSQASLLICCNQELSRFSGPALCPCNFILVKIGGVECL